MSRKIPAYNIIAASAVGTALALAEDLQRKGGKDNRVAALRLRIASAVLSEDNPQDNAPLKLAAWMLETLEGHGPALDNPLRAVAALWSSLMAFRRFDTASAVAELTLEQHKGLRYFKKLKAIPLTTRRG